MTDNRNLSLRKLTGSWLKRAAMAGLRFAFLLLSGLWSATWYLLVFAGLLLWLSLDLLPSRKSKPSTSPAPQPPKHPYYNRPHFIQEGSTVSIEMPDGQIIALEPLSASLMVKEGVECLAAAYVFEKTRIKLDADV
jgi:hypothetical protein